jgi:Protein of unknown function (DUF2799)
MRTLGVVILLAGCALFPIEEADCRGADWARRGYADGFAGHPPQDLRLARDCGRYGIAVSETQYLAGWRDGYDEWYRLIGSMQRRGR